MTTPEKNAATGKNEPEGLRAWFGSLEYVLAYLLNNAGGTRAPQLLDRLWTGLREAGVPIPAPTRTPYTNTIPSEDEPPYPGDLALERRIKSCVRWNAMAMVVKANRHESGIGGHISTYASLATLYEVAFNHFLRGRDGDRPADIVYFQGHSAPGVYARAFLERRLDSSHLDRFRQELGSRPGLSSYPHPYLMPDFWQFPSVSMGLSPIMSIYQARFNRYLKARGLLPGGDEPRVWCFIGDGETDEPETLGALSLAGREELDNLTWVVNCNLQRLDGPVRGNGKIIQELESVFRGAGWNVIKVIWGRDWDPLFQADRSGLLLKRMEEAVDGDFQKYSVEPGSYIRRHFFGRYPELRELVNHLTDQQIHKLIRGGHDPRRVYAAYHAAVRHRGAPTVILAKTVKGYGLGEAGEGRNVTHQQKKLNEKELREFRSRFNIPISDEEVAETPFYRFPDDSAETRYVADRRRALGGALPARRVEAARLGVPANDAYAEFFTGSGHLRVSTTMAFVRILTRLLRDEQIGRRIVPIVPDEARTFGMDALFRQIGIYSPKGQLYEPVDRESLLYYQESKDGQILEEGISEAGSMSSFIAAGTAYATHGVELIPFFTFYSMFGFQRIGDLIWAAADSRAKGFLLGATAGRTTLSGEGLQHQDGHSHLIAESVPSLLAYDPAFAFELAVIIQDGLRRMVGEGEEIFYYLTLYNEPYPMPKMPDGVEDGILKGLYKFKAGPVAGRKAQILASGPIVREALRAQELLASRGVSADVWSATSWKRLRTDALETARWNRLHPREPQRSSFLERAVESESGAFVAATDYVKAVPDLIAPWIPGGLETLGTDGFGRSDGRTALRRFFEVDAEMIAVATLAALARRGDVPPDAVAAAMADFQIEADKTYPAFAK